MTALIVGAVAGAVAFVLVGVVIYRHLASQLARITIVFDGKFTRHFPPKVPGQSTTPLDEHDDLAIEQSQQLPAEEAQR